MDITKKDIKNAIDSAIDSLIGADLYLLKVDSSERSITHRLAIHLIPHFPDFDIDCEFNRDGFDPKRLALSECNVSNEEADAVTVFPDIVVHQRGTEIRNLVAVEVKKASSVLGSDYDRRKLQAFKSDLQYKFAVHVVIGYTKDQRLVRQVEWIDG